MVYVRSGQRTAASSEVYAPTRQTNEYIDLFRQLDYDDKSTSSSTSIPIPTPLSIHPSIHPSTSMFPRSAVRPSIHPSVCLSVRPSLSHQSFPLTVHQFISVSIHPSFLP